MVNGIQALHLGDQITLNIDDTKQVQPMAYSLKNNGLEKAQLHDILSSKKLSFSSIVLVRY